jgi:hypothetical protein
MNLLFDWLAAAFFASLLIALIIAFVEFPLLFLFVFFVFVIKSNF